MKKQTTLLILFLVTGSLFAACGGGSGENPAENQEENQQENQNENQEPGVNVAEVPQHLLIELSPTRFAYAVDTRITPQAKVYNYNWELLEDARVSWTVSPEELVERDGERNRWYMRGEGEVTFRGCAEVPSIFPAVCASRTVVVTNGAPTIVLERPLPGEHFHGDEYEKIPVEGVVATTQNVDRVQINGVYVEVDEQKRFATEITPHFGINTVFVRAFDGINPADGLAAASFIWAPDFHDVHYDAEVGRLTTSLEDAIILRLGQNFFDNGNPPTIVSDSQILTEDLADIIYLVLQFLDMTAQIPDPVVDSSGFVLSVPEVIVEHPRVEIDVTDTGLQLYAQVEHLIAETTGYIELSDQTLSLNGAISARLSIFAEIDVAKLTADDPVVVDLTHFELAIEEATPNFTSPEANAIFELAESALRDQLESIIMDSVNLSFIDTLPELLVDVFTSLEEAMSYQPFDLDLGFGEPLLLEFSGQIGQLQPVHRQGLDGHVQAQLTVVAPRTFPDNPGVARMARTSTDFPFFEDSRIQIGLNLSLINAIFHNLWDSGLLELDVTEMIPSNFANLIQNAEASGKLPPVAAAPIRDEGHDLMLHVGQLELNLGWNDRTDRFGARISVGIDMNIAGESIAIDISDEPFIELWLIETTADQPLLDADALLTVIRTQLWPEIEAAIGEGLTFGLPVPEIGALDEFAPQLSDLNLDVRMTRPMAIREGFLMIDAAFEGELFMTD